MKILVFSDSHRSIQPIRDVLDKIGEKAQCVVHLGDLVEDAQAVAALYPRYRHYAVSGNCDFHYDSLESEERVLNLSDCKILLTHGHRYGVKRDYSRIVYAAEEAGVQICLFGHTHVPVTFAQSGICFMNPGSISLPRQTGYSSYGVIDLGGYGSTSGGKTPCSVVGKINGLYRPVDVDIDTGQD